MRAAVAHAPSPRAADIRSALLWSVLLLVVSWLNVQAGIYLGHRHVPRGAGYPRPTDVQADLYRFDGGYYRGIADSGYFYDGNPSSGPNIVFAPMFPLLVRLAASITGLDSLTAGFMLNRMLLFGALVFLLLCLDDWIGRRRAIVALGALATAGGSYAFHAYYSESTFLFFLALSLLAWTRGWWWVAALAAGALGASRLTGLPVALAFAALFSLRARTSVGAARWGFTACALLCLAGAAVYMALIGSQFGNPFRILYQVQQVSWAAFHPETDWPRLLTGGYLIDYWREALALGPRTVGRIHTANLIWTTLGLLAFGYVILRWRAHVLSYVFVPYFLFIYVTNTSSPFLIGAHRYFTVMFPIFMMFTALHVWLSRRVSPVVAWAVSGCLLLANAAYGMLHTAAFNQGVWFWF